MGKPAVLGGSFVAAHDLERPSAPADGGPGRRHSGGRALSRSERSSD
ncbi:hypothetical protein NOCARDAX2BIS_400144 [Nocardioides sp. AX2bis]|nr:hypothetical protein NOCARDAX2BIS_400144 [Nocardioides sp. AX2bis]